MADEGKLCCKFFEIRLLVGEGRAWGLQARGFSAMMGEARVNVDRKGYRLFE